MMYSSCSQLFWVHFFFLIIHHFASRSVAFLPADNVTLSGDAHFRNNAIILTQELNCLPFSSSSSSSPSSSSSSGVGRAFYVNPIRFLDLATNSTASFTSRFSLSVIQTPFCPFADGIAFLITSDNKSFSRSHGYMGLPKSPHSFFAVEFDTDFHADLGDINDNHLGIDVNTPISITSVDVGSKGIILKSGRPITAWIEYRDDLKMIRVWVGYSHTRPESPLLVAQIDLSKQFKEFMYVGFSASNGQGSALYVVERWRFKTFGLVSSLVPIDSINEGDCFMCSSDDLSNNDSRSTSSEKRRTKTSEMVLGLGGLAAFSCSVILILGLFSYVLIKKMRNVTMRGRAYQTCEVQTNRVPTRLSLGEIKSATMGFNRNRIIGEGGSATVYKGSLPSGGEVAVKRFERGNSNDCLSNPFTTEFATMVGCLRHKNLVQLHGWCCEGNELLLVYEFLPNGSLAKVLHRSSNASFVLPWKKRFTIALGVASALTYLHEECESQIIHRDVKTCNIMLDADFNAKLGDFGLAEVYEHSSITREATIPAGTMGYLAPEYVYSGVPTVKTDVYSYGVVILEIASGRRPVNDDGSVLVNWVWELWEMGKLIESSDSKLMGKYNVVEMERMLMVGLYCVHPNHEKRPTVKEAAMILKGETPLPVLPSRKPRVSLMPVFPDEKEEVEEKEEEDMLDFCGDSLNLDDSAWMTPKSHFG